MNRGEDITLPEIQQVKHHLAIEDPEGVRKFALSAMTLSIGRNPTNDIVLRSSTVSRQHAILLRIPLPQSSSHLFRIIDGNLQGKRSTNGILINGQRRFSHILALGDEIIFSPDTHARYEIAALPAKSTLTMPGTAKSSEGETILTVSESLGDYSEEMLARLASFPELNPNPILEVNLIGAITYANPAANDLFPNLYELGSKHPTLRGVKGVATRFQHNGQKNHVREIEIEDRVYEQFLHYIAGSDLIRSYLLDITERKRTQEIIQYKTSHDPLTGLPNRLFFNDFLTTTITQMERSGESVAVVFLDLDRFKLVNDSLGHTSGDRLLKIVCDRLQTYLKPGDLLARWGGDEFILLFRQIDSGERAVRYAGSLLRAFEQPFLCDGHELYISCSIGISIYPYDGVDGETLIKHADIAMDRAKESGRNNCQLYTAAMNERALERLSMENQLYRALDRSEFVVYYQPLVDLKRQKIAGAEALIRWHHPVMGLLTPDAFIPLAEETGLIVPIGYWMLRAVCAQHQLWLSAGLPPIQLAVNLSIQQFKQTDFIANLGTILEEMDFNPIHLELELTESIMMENAAENIDKLQKLRDMGIDLAIDDFGTGYSSLSYLKSLPIDVLKIDPSFIRDITENPHDLAIARSIVSLAHNLRLRAIAEGVETVEQMEVLQGLDCTDMQGFLFKRPVPAAELTDVLRQPEVLWPLPRV